MKKLAYLQLAASMLLCSASALADDCGINLSVVSVPQTEKVPAATVNYLNNKLTQLVTNTGISADPGMSQFFIAGRFSHIFEDVVPGPPTQTALHTTLTLYIGDMSSESVYATTTIDLRGVGTSDQRAYINALRQVNARNSRVSSFIEAGKEKVIDYFNKQYPQILKRAERLAASHDYEAALWQLAPVPECCVGYPQVEAAILRYFQAFIDQQGQALYAKAYSSWGASPDAVGAAEAFEYLAQIDPASAYYPKAQALAQEIKKTVKSDYDFENRQKYNDAIDLKRSTIEAARQVGVAYGRGQQPTTTNLMWLR